MTDQRPDDEELDPRLEDFRDAVHDMYVAGLNTSRADEDKIVPTKGDDNTSGAEKLAAIDGVHRLFLLHTVASNLNRWPSLLGEHEDAEDRLASAVARPDDPRQNTDDVRAGLRRFATERDDAGAEPGGALTPARWRAFLALIQEPPDDPAPPAPPANAPPPFPAIGKPGCNDEAVVQVPAGAASTVRSRFTVDRDLDAAGAFIDPMRWVECGRPFWTRMSVADRSHTKLDDGYTAVFEERVVLPIVGEVTAWLRVRFRKTPRYIVARYEVAGPPFVNEYVTFDNGWLAATRVDERGGPPRTLIEGVKAIRFSKQQYNAYPDLVCDGGWVHFMINMALAGLGLPPRPLGVTNVARPVTDPGTLVSGLDGIVDEWVEGSKASLDACGRSAKAAVAKALAVPCDPRWVNDVVGMGAEAPASATRTVNAVRKALDELSKLGGPR